MTPADKMIALEERLHAVQAKMGMDMLKYAEDYHLLITEIGHVKKELLKNES